MISADSFKQEKMTSKRANPLCRPYSEGNPSQVIFRRDTQFLRGLYYQERCVNVFVNNETVCTASWVVHVRKIRVIGLAIFRPFWDFRTGNDLKIT